MSSPHALTLVELSTEFSTLTVVGLNTAFGVPMADLSVVKGVPASVDAVFATEANGIYSKAAGASVDIVFDQSASAAYRRSVAAQADIVIDESASAAYRRQVAAQADIVFGFGAIDFDIYTTVLATAEANIVFGSDVASTVTLTDKTFVTAGGAIQFAGELTATVTVQPYRYVVGDLTTIFFTPSAVATGTYRADASEAIVIDDQARLAAHMSASADVSFAAEIDDPSYVNWVYADTGGAADWRRLA